ncbi:T9SS type B sorting domain-containing protein [Ascidiimonas sp. W6]|uniref:T9SS type B sorting domain-containing protein n=1 Tax=Ascidiimonas meishanensis TaxID=3128903 RepID=UPI0030EDC2FE
MKKAIFCIVAFFTIFQSWSQGEAAYWYFGKNAGVYFDPVTKDVSVLTDGVLNTFEGCSTISDENGNLQFYSDGVTVWDRNHNIMPNGTELKGDESSTQSGLIVPHPTLTSIYYLFTVDEPHNANFSVSDIIDVSGDGDGFNNGLNYSVIDMSLNGGLGDIIPGQKNIPLITYNPGDRFENGYKCSEKITAVEGGQENTFWVITHFTENFYAFKIDSNGVNETPVTSFAEPEVPVSGYRRNALGYLKASPDGTKIAAAFFSISEIPGADAPGNISLFDFDNITGRVNNSTELYNGDAPYGIEFSLETRKLYAVVGRGSGGGGNSFLIQYDLRRADVKNSMTIIDESSDYNYGALQLGLDGKIYRSQIDFLQVGAGTTGKYLGVIENPEATAANVIYNPQAIYLDVNNDGSNEVRLGLPPFIQSFFLNKIDIIRNGISDTFLELCTGDTYTLVADDIPGATYLWEKDEVPLAETGNTLTITNASAAAIGFYTVRVEPNNGDPVLEGTADVDVIPLPVVQNTSLTQCDFDGDGSTIFNLEQSIGQIVTDIDLINTFEYTFHENLNDAQNELNAVNSESYSNIANPQIVYVRVENKQKGCFSVAELELSTSFTPPLTVNISACADGGVEGFALFDLNQASAALTLGPGITLTYYLTENEALNETNALDTNFENTLPFNQTIYARAENNNQCAGINVVNLQVNELPDIQQEQDVFICENSAATYTISAGIPISETGDYTYEWQTNERQNTPAIEITDAGSYRVIVTNSGGCSVERTIRVNSSNIAVIDDIKIRDLRQNNNITILVTGSGNYEYALENSNGPYQDSNKFSNLPPGFVTVYVRDKNGCGITQQGISILGYPNFFTPNGDGINDTWQLIGGDQLRSLNTFVYIYDRYGKLITQLNAAGSGWDGLFNGRQLPSSDYWFRIVLEDGRQFNGHFALKR